MSKPWNAACSGASMGSVLFKSIQLQTFSVALRFSTVPARVLLGESAMSCGGSWKLWETCCSGFISTCADTYPPIMANGQIKHTDIQPPSMLFAGAQDIHR